MEDPARVGVQAEEAPGHIPLVGGDDGILRHVLDLVGLRVGVRDGGVEGVFVGPLGAGRERFVGEEGANEVERVGGFVDVHVDVGEGDAEVDEVAAVIVGISACGRERDDVPAELAGVDREAAEAVDEIVKGTVAGSVVAKNPGRGTLLIFAGQSWGHHRRSWIQKRWDLRRHI